MQIDYKESKTSSRKRLEELNAQQKNLSKIFQISNFYKDKKFDLDGLKKKIQQVRQRNIQKQFKSISYHVPHEKQIQLIPRKGLTKNDNANRKINNSSFESYNNPQIILPSASKNKTNNINRHRYHISQQTKSNYKLQKQLPKLQVSTLESQQRVIIDNQQALNQYQHNIQSLWSLYELLARIMQGIQSNPFCEEVSLIKYVEDVCSDKFQFIADFLDNVLLKRFHRTIILGRLLENIAIVYFIIEICQRKKLRSAHIINFIGFCTSNIIFLIRLITLSYDIKLQLSYSIQTILRTIKTFEIQSYMQQIKSIKQVVLRMEHNNETVKIVELKLSSEHNKEFQSSITHFLRYVDKLHQPFYQYGHYIFQFLSYYLNKQKLIGILPYLQIAPTPYLTMKLPQTVIIQPWGVLIYQKNSKLYIRAHTQLFITKISKYCNVIIWSDLMPQQLDPLLSILPSGPNIEYLYRYHCKHQDSNMVKIIWRSGCSPQNTIIIDRNKNNFIYDIQSGIQLAWKGQKKDSQLITMMEKLIPLFNNGLSLRQQLGEIRGELNTKHPKKKRINLVRKYWRPNDNALINLMQEHKKTKIRRKTKH